jgi:chemotaxis protein MotB
VRVVDDRFVFQSEVLFSIGSAELGEEGQKQLNELIKALKEIGSKIPPEINWILRVDGHTDKHPIKSAQFPSNWELSAARAIAVVQYMIKKGINGKHLVAAGFGEFQPINVEEVDRNRRIEFKLDQR